MSLFFPLSDLKSWIPYKLENRDDQLVFRWLYIGNKPYTEPFFEDTIRKAMSFSENSKLPSFTTNEESLINLAAKSQCIEPTAFIFHVSRCGSTLLSQILSLQKENIVLSEVPLIDQILRMDKEKESKSAITKNERLQSLIRLLSQVRDDEKHCFIKLDCWHIFYYKLIRETYPNIPFILLFRNPMEVIESHIERRGSQLIPGMIDHKITGLREEDTLINLDAYMVKIFEKLYSGMYEIAQNDPFSILLDYAEGPKNWCLKLQNKMPLIFASSIIKAIERRSAFHSKYPDQVYVDKKKSDGFSGDLAFLYSIYRQLDQLKTAVSPKNVLL